MIAHALMILGLLMTADDPKDSLVKKETAKFQGTWKFASMEVEGQRKPDEEMKKYTVTIQGDHWTVGDKTASPMTFKVDPAGKPKTIDFILPKGRVVKGIYSEDKDRVTVCYRSGQEKGERPTAFTTGPDSRLTLYVLTRQAKPGDPEEAVKQEMAKFQGTWKFVSMDVDGSKKPDQDFKKYTVVLKDDQWTVWEGDKIAAQVTFKLDPTKHPRTVDLIDVKNKRLIRGIYCLKGDTLTVCDRGSEKGNRPTEFGTRTGTGFVQFVLKRDKP